MYLRDALRRKDGKAHTYWRLVRSGAPRPQGGARDRRATGRARRRRARSGERTRAGDRVDATTVKEIVGTMEARYGTANRVWVVDPSMASAGNLAWLRQTGRRYLIGTAKSELRKWAAQITASKAWITVRDGSRRSCSTASACTSPNGSDPLRLDALGLKR